ncbi:MAG: hypothetical protein R2712_20450 [Vicinamibacterales bacterium]
MSATHPGSPETTSDVVAVVPPSQLDFDEYVALQRAAFAEVVDASGMASLLAPAFYRWKYHTPFGDARIATVRSHGRLVAANAMFPLEVAHQGQRSAPGSRATRRRIPTPAARATSSAASPRSRPRSATMRSSWGFRMPTPRAGS